MTGETEAEFYARVGTAGRDELARRVAVVSAPGSYRPLSMQEAREALAGIVDSYHLTGAGYLEGGRVRWLDVADLGPAVQMHDVGGLWAGRRQVIP